MSLGGKTADAAGAVHADPALYTSAIGGAESNAPDRDGRIRPNFGFGVKHEIVRVPRRMSRTKVEGAGNLGKTIWTSSIVSLLQDPEFNELNCGIWNDMSREASRLARARGTGALRAPTPAANPAKTEELRPGSTPAKASGSPHGTSTRESKHMGNLGTPRGSHGTAPAFKVDWNSPEFEITAAIAATRPVKCEARPGGARLRSGTCWRARCVSRRKSLRCADTSETAGDDGPHGPRWHLCADTSETAGGGMACTRGAIPFT